MGRISYFKRGLVWIGFLAVVLTGGVRNARADFTFGRPINLGSVVNNSANEQLTDVSADGLELYFISQSRPGGQGNWDIWVSTRQTKDAAWGPPENLGPTVNTPSSDTHASISGDGLSLYITSDRAGGYTAGDMWVTTRATRADEWGIPVNLGPMVNSGSASYVGYPDISADGLSLYFCSNQAGGSGGPDLCVTTRETTDDDWGEPVNLSPTVNDTARDADPGISSDGLLLFFGSVRAAGLGAEDIWVTRRATVSDPWGLPVNVGLPVSTSADDWAPNVSGDGRTLYFCSDRPGGYGGWDIWQAPIIPIVDFTSDGKVDIQDLLRLIESWGKDDPSVDMAPMPLGDGKVDANDLEVLMSYWQQEILPPELVAYWKLDEAEGSIAEDRASDNDGVLRGEPLWQPEGGKKDGALAFDGIDDYVETGFVLDPAGGDFSILAWIQGGAPGQVILSQTDGPSGAGEIWLGADAIEGKLMTKLRSPSGRSPAPSMVADAIITDGRWHHLGIVVTEQKVRHLYVDGIRVAFDSQPVVLPSSDGDLYIGAGKSLDTGTFFSGLIDDLRIYNKALTTDEIAALAQ